MTSKYIYSEKALIEKIRKKFGEVQNLKNILDWLKNYGAIDDDRNKDFIVNKLKEKGYGAEYIKQSLKRKGFNNEIEIENSEDDIRKWFEKKIRQIEKPLDRKKIGRIYRYLISKGFKSEEVLNFLKKEGIYEGQRD